MNRKNNLLLLLLLMPLATEAQMILQKALNMPRSGDNIVMEKVLGFPLGEGGKDIIWDATAIELNDAETEIDFFHSDDSCQTLSKAQDQSIYHYLIKNDSVMLSGYESNLLKMSFNEPVTACHFPFCFGDSLVSYFHAEGLYCEKISFRACGYYKTKADAYGKLVLPCGDTLNHVLRLKSTIKVGNVSVCSYKWYVLGYRYPLFEKLLYTLPDGTNEQRTFYLSIDSQANFDDEENKVIRSGDESTQLTSGTDYAEVEIRKNMNRKHQLKIRHIGKRPSDMKGSVYTQGGITISNLQK